MACSEEPDEAERKRESGLAPESIQEEAGRALATPSGLHC